MYKSRALALLRNVLPDWILVSALALVNNVGDASI